MRIQRSRLLLSAALAVVPVPALATQTQDGTPPEGQSASSTDQVAANAAQRDVDIVVTARRREERLQDVPIAVSAVSGDTLVAQGTTDLTSLPIPSLNVTNGAVQRASFAFAIRGQRTNESQLLTDPPVATYFAEVVQPRPFGFGDTLYDIQNVQVLKGVQGTLFGRNVTGGAIIVTPNRPTSRLEGEIKGQYGSYDNRLLYAMLNLPFGNDAGGFRVSGQYRKRDGYTRDISNGRRYDDIDYGSFRASLLGKLGALETLLIGDYYLSKTNGSATIPEAAVLSNACNNVNINCAGGAIGAQVPTVLGQLDGLRRFGNPAGGIPPQTQFPDVLGQLGAVQAARQNRFFSFNPGAGEGGRNDAIPTLPNVRLQNVGVTNISTLDVGFGTLKNIAGYRHVTFERHTDLDGLPAFLIDSESPTDIKQYSEELQLNGSAFSDRMTYTLGGYYFLEEGRDGSLQNQFPQLASLGIAQALVTNFRVPLTASQFGAILSAPASAYLADARTNSGRAETASAYAAGTYKIAATFSVAGGIRYTWDKRTAQIGQTRPNILSINASTIPGFTPISQLALLVCDYNPNQPDASGTIRQIDTCRFENGKSWDAVTYDATLQYEPSDSTTAYVSTRRGFRAGGLSLRARGDATFQPFDPETVQEYEFGLKNQFRFGGAKLNTELAVFYQDYKNVQKQNPTVIAGQVQTIVTNTAKQKNYGGEFQANLNLDNGIYVSAFYAYVEAEVTSGGNGSFDLIGQPNHQVGGSLGYGKTMDWGRIDANLNANYKSRQHLDDYDVAGDEPAFAVLNARIGVGDIGGSGIGLAGFVSNLADKKYRVGVLGLMDTVGTLGSIYGEPRQWGFEASLKF